MKCHRPSCPASSPRFRVTPGIVLLCSLLAAAWFLPADSVLASTPLEQELAHYNGWKMKSFHLEGVPDGLVKELKGGLAFTGRSRFLRRNALPDFQTRILLEDIARIRLFLAREGYPGARVTAEVTPGKTERSLDLTLTVTPGEPVMVGELIWRDWPEGLALPDLAGKETLQVGQRYRDDQLASSREYLRRLLRDQGYALAEVTADIRPLDPRRVEITYTVAANEHYEITGTSIAGCSEDLIGLTDRLMNIHTPEEFSQKKLDEGAFNLRGTQLYRKVGFTAQPIGPGQVHLTTNVENARMRSLESSIGTFSDNPWMIRAGWTHRNLFRKGRGFDVKAALATHNREAGMGLTWFGWFSPRGRTRLGAQHLYENEDAYLAKEWRLDLTHSVRLQERDLLQAGISISRVDLTNYSETEQDLVDHEGYLSEIWTDRKWDRTDDPLYPTRAGFLKLRAVVSPPGNLSDAPYLQFQGDVSQYRSLGGGVVAAGRLRAGYSRPLGDASDLIANRRFYAGGYSTMRGYGRRGLGPRDEENVARGGNVVLLAGAELRAPLFWLLELGLFVDSGQVWRDARDLDLGDMEAAAGLSLDFRTPLGPVRLGYAWNLTEPYSGEPVGLFHFGVGYPW